MIIFKSILITAIAFQHFMLGYANVVSKNNTNYSTDSLTINIDNYSDHYYYNNILKTMNIIMDTNDTECWGEELNNLKLFECSTTVTNCLCVLQPSFSYTFLALGGLSLMGSMIIIIGYIAYQELRIKPGDTILGICISYALVSANYFVISLIDLINVQIIQPDGFYCNLTSLIELCSIFSSYLFSFGFCFYNITALKTSLKVAKIEKFFPYLYVIMVISYGIFLIFHHPLLGMSMSGTCSGKTANGWNSVLTETVLAPVFTVVSLFTYYYMMKYTPSCDKINEAKKTSLRYYFRYFISSSILYGIMTTLIFFDLHWMAETKDINRIRKFKYIIQIFRLIAAMLISVVRYFDPFLKQYMTKLFYAIFTCGTRTPGSSIQSQDDQLNMSLDFGFQRNRVDSLGISLTLEREEESNWLNRLSHNMKVQVVYSILSGIIYFNSNARKTALKDSITKAKELKHDKPAYYKYLAKQVRKYRINDDVILANLPEIAKEIQKNEYNTLEGELTIYAPQIFYEWIQNDEILINFDQSLDLKQNYSRIQRAGKATGGKSGEFFFFSYDNKLIIKTITNEEALILIETLDKFASYFDENKDTMIAKIYGLFTYKRVDINETYNLIVMRNINGFPSIFTERKYDMKGSTYDREVLKGQNLTLDALKSRPTLKDQDFLKYEQKLYISEEDKEKLIDSLEKDVDLLKSCGLIDYSLAVYIVNKTKLFKSIKLDDDMNNSECNDITTDTDMYKSLNTNFIDPAIKNPLYSIKSTKEEDLYYHIGIIDYLQLYTMQKKIEKLSKRIVKMNINLDTSAQDPDIYAQRFKKFVRMLTSTS